MPVTQRIKHTGGAATSEAKNLEFPKCPRLATQIERVSQNMAARATLENSRFDSATARVRQETGDKANVSPDIQEATATWQREIADNTALQTATILGQAGQCKTANIVLSRSFRRPGVDVVNGTQSSKLTRQLEGIVKKIDPTEYVSFTMKDGRTIVDVDRSGRSNLDGAPGGYVVTSSKVIKVDEAGSTGIFNGFVDRSNTRGLEKKFIYDKQENFVKALVTPWRDDGTLDLSQPTAKEGETILKQIRNMKGTVRSPT